MPDDFQKSNLEALKVSSTALAAIDQSETSFPVRGVIVTTKGDGENYDFYSRYFAPWVGIDEDPVTGSAHTVLGPYWSEKLGRKKLKARQCSPRGGDILVAIPGDGKRVHLTGAARVFSVGDLFV